MRPSLGRTAMLSQAWDAQRCSLRNSRAGDTEFSACLMSGVQGLILKPETKQKGKDIQIYMHKCVCMCLCAQLKDLLTNLRERLRKPLSLSTEK